MSEDTKILIPGHEIAPDQLPKMPLRLYNLAFLHGFEVKAGYSKFQEAVVVYSDKAKKAGESRGGEIRENHWIDAVHPERKVKFTAVWHDGSFANAYWNTWTMVKSTVLSKLIKGEEEE